MRNLISGLAFLAVVSWWPAFCQDVAPPLDIGGRSNDKIEYDQHWISAQKRVGTARPNARCSPFRSPFQGQGQETRPPAGA